MKKEELKYLKFTILFLSFIFILTFIVEVNRQRNVQYVEVFPIEDVNKRNENGDTKEYVEFRDAVAHKESSNDYQKINSGGYAGRYQFGKSALMDVGIKDKHKFLKNPKVQDKAFKALCKMNKYRLRNFISKHEGEIINGIEVTESGLLAAAHLLGTVSVKEYLNSGGKVIRRDGNNTSLELYLELFQGYELGIKAEKEVKIQ